MVFNGAYVEPYGTFVGQIVLAGVLATFALSVLWLRRLSGVAEPERFLELRAASGRAAVVSRGRWLAGAVRGRGHR